MTLAEEYRSNAQECVRHAGTAPNARDKGHWLKLAEHWLRLAHEADRHPDIF